MTQPRKIAIVVHGRFHAFDFARALIAKGHDVTLFTNYPRFITRQFGLPSERVRPFLAHGAVSRVAYRSVRLQQSERFESWLHERFGRWAARQLLKEAWDVIYSWSGVSEPILRKVRTPDTLRLVVRGSAHIRTQAELLLEEQRRTGVPQEHPSVWRTLREEREYLLADAVVVLSSFCRQTFLDQGFPEDRVRRMLSGTRVGAFRPGPEVIEERCRRILSGEPLRVLNVGTFSYRKGIFDLAEMVRAVDPSRFRFRMIGTVHPEAEKLAAELAPLIEFVPRVPQPELPGYYAGADLFLFPTIEDGFPAVLAQAAAGGLPTLTTPNGAGDDVVRNDETGWVLPIRNPRLFVEKLTWCDRNREALTRMVREMYGTFKVRDWSAVADTFTEICDDLIAARQKAPAARRVSRPLTAQDRHDVGKLAIVVHGRFYIFDLARELIRQGMDLTVLTNYPPSVVKRFGIPLEHARTCLPHGLLGRAIQRLGMAGKFESALHRSFSKWALRQLQAGKFSGIKCLSGVAEETFRSVALKNSLKVVVRGSSHIETQSRLLKAEEKRAGVPLDRPSAWRIAREQREYDLADAVLVLSSFARRSFLEEGFPNEKLRTLNLGSSVRLFRPSRTVIEERCRRIASGEPLRVLNVGSFSFRKGALDLLEIARACCGRMRFRMVGDWLRETSALRQAAAGSIEFVKRQPEATLPLFYEWADVFVFPTIEDGYAAVLAQAQASGLPILATGNCAAPDIIQEGETGWVLPIRSANDFVTRLRWCDEHRLELASIAREVYETGFQRDWSLVAEDFVTIWRELLSQSKRTRGTDGSLRIAANSVEAGNVKIFRS